MNKKLIATGAVAASMLGGAAFGATLTGVAGAQEDGTESSDARPDREARRQERVEALAEALGVSVEALQEGREAGQTLAEVVEANGGSVDAAAVALTDLAEAHISEKLEAGDITQEEADERLAGLAQKVDERLNSVPGEGRHGPRGQRGQRGQRLGNLAEVIGVDAEVIRDGIQSGSTLAEVAAANDVTQDELVEALVDGAIERSNAAVESGRITQEEADERLADVEERITERVTSEDGFAGRRGPGRGDRGPQGAPDGAPEDVAA